MAPNADPPTRSRLGLRSRIGGAGLTAATAAVMGRDAGVAVPLQRHPPKFVVTAGGAEIAALGLFMITGSPVAFAAMLVAAAGLLALAATNRRLVLAVTASELVVVAASRRGRPLAPTGSTSPHRALPEPSGLGVPIGVDGHTWWVDRSAFPRLRRAQELCRGV